MKKLLVLFFLCLFAGSAWAQKEEKQGMPKMLGAGVAISGDEYKGKDTEVKPVPIVFWEYERFFVRGMKLGVVLAESDKVDFDFYLSPRLMGYESDVGLTEPLAGMEDRDGSIDAGIEASFDCPFFEGSKISLSFAGDMLGEHKGQAAELSFSHLFNWRSFFLKPSFGIGWWSEDLVDYYYGVRSNEARANRPQYSPDGTINPVLKIDAGMALSREWMIVSEVKVEFFDDEISDSPIVDEEYNVGGIVGVARMF